VLTEKPEDRLLEISLLKKQLAAAVNQLCDAANLWRRERKALRASRLQVAGILHFVGTDHWIPERSQFVRPRKPKSRLRAVRATEQRSRWKIRNVVLLDQQRLGSLSYA